MLDFKGFIGGKIFLFFVWRVSIHFYFYTAELKSFYSSHHG